MIISESGLNRAIKDAKRYGGYTVMICHPYLLPFSTVKAPVASATLLNFWLWYKPEREVS